LQTYLKKLFCFEWLKDQIKMRKLKLFLLCRKNNVDFVPNGCFGAKSSSIGHSKTALAANLANIFLEINSCFVSLKDQIKMHKIAILSSHAFLEK
jgi:hypothetical protein